MMLYGIVTVGIIYLAAVACKPEENIFSEDGGGQTARTSPRLRCPFIRNSLINGKVKIRSKGRIAKFICKNGYELVGRRFATCLRGQWNSPIPICVTNGCPVIFSPVNGRMDAEIPNALVSFSCDPGYTLSGSSRVYCNGANWNATVPYCLVNSVNPEYKCDFEEPDVCGWEQDRYHDFDWRRHQYSTPSGHVGTGPSFDHTRGKDNDGYYMYIEASSPRKTNDTARLFSPVYYGSKSTPGCFVFWYHMYGNTIGTLRVYIKGGSQVLRELQPVWEKTGPQGNVWRQGAISVPEIKHMFQIVIEGIRGSSYVGDIAIDDVALQTVSCEELGLANATGGADSCQQRCFTDSDANSTCGCGPECVETLTCCEDYGHFCTDLANKTADGLFSIEPTPKQENNPTEHSQVTVEGSSTVQTEVAQTLASDSLVSNVSVLIASSSSSTSAVSSQSSLQKEISTNASSKGSSSFTTGIIPVTTSWSTTRDIERTSLPTTISSIAMNITKSQTLIYAINSTQDKKEKRITSPSLTVKETVSSRRSTSVQREASQPVTMMVSSPKPLVTDTTRRSNTPTGTYSKISTLANVPSSLESSYTFTTVRPNTPKLITPLILHSTSKPATPKIVTTPTSSNKIVMPKPVTVPIVSTSRSTGIEVTAKLSTPKSLTVSVGSTTPNAPSFATPLMTTLTTPTSKLITTPIFTSRPPTTTTATRSTSTKTQRLPYPAPTTIWQRKTSLLNITKLPEVTPLNTTYKSSTVGGIFRTYSTGKAIESTRVSMVTPSTTRRPKKAKGSTIRILLLTKKTKMIKSTTPFTQSATPKNSTKRTSIVFPNKNTTYFRSPLSTTVIANFSSSQSATSLLLTSTRKYQKTSSIKTAKMATAVTDSHPRSSSTEGTLSTAEQSVKDTRATDIWKKATKQPLTTKAKKSLPNMPETVDVTLSPTSPSEKLPTTYKPDFKSRTKYRTYLQKPSTKETVSIVLVAAVTVASVSVLLLIAVILACFICRRRRIAQSKLSDDSEMRFLSDSEIIEFADPSSKLYSESAD